MSGECLEVRNQAELDAALADGACAHCVGDGEFQVYGSSTVRAYDSSTVYAYGSSTVRAYGSSTVRADGSSTVHAYDSSTVRAYDSSTVRAYGSSTVHAYGSSTVHAYDSSTVHAYDSSTVRAGKCVPVHKLSPRSTVDGGIVIDIPDLTVTKNWLDYYGVEVKRGYATLFKGVNDEWLSGYGTSYKPGSKPTAPDWKPTNDCGGGLHFSPHAFMTRAYCTPDRFVAVKVKVADLVVIGDPTSADKVKAPSCVVLHECTEDGERIELDEDGVEIKTAEPAA